MCRMRVFFTMVDYNEKEEEEVNALIRVHAVPVSKIAFHFRAQNENPRGDDVTVSTAVLKSII